MAYFDRLLSAHEGSEPVYVGTQQTWEQDGPDPLDVIAFFPVEEPTPHWHAAGYGLSAEGAEDDPGRGWDFELSARVARAPDEELPPDWIFSWLQNLAAYVAETGRPLSPGDQMQANGPLREDSPTELQAMLFREDPALDPLVEPTVVQVIGVTMDELAAKRCWRAAPMLELLEGRLGAELIVDLERPSVLGDPAVAREAADGALRDGSSTTTLAIERLELDRGRRIPRRGPSVSIDAIVAEDLGLMVAARLDHGEQLDLEAKDGTVLHVKPGEQVSLAQVEGSHWRLELPPTATQWLREELGPRAGTYRPASLWPLALEVRPIDVTDRDGEVLYTVG